MQFQPSKRGLQDGQAGYNIRGGTVYSYQQRLPKKLAGKQQGGFLSSIATGSNVGDTDRIGSQAASSAMAGRKGIVDAFVKTCERWQLDVDEQMILLGYEPGSAIGEQVLAGRMNVTSTDMRDRAAYVVSISLGLGTIFCEVGDAEVDWLNLPRERLDGKSPVKYMLEGRMANLILIDEMVKRERGL